MFSISDMLGAGLWYPILWMAWHYLSSHNLNHQNLSSVLPPHLPTSQNLNISCIYWNIQNISLSVCWLRWLQWLILLIIICFGLFTFVISIFLSYGCKDFICRYKPVFCHQSQLLPSFYFSSGRYWLQTISHKLRVVWSKNKTVLKETISCCLLLQSSVVSRAQGSELRHQHQIRF